MYSIFSLDSLCRKFKILKCILLVAKMKGNILHLYESEDELFIAVLLTLIMMVKLIM